MTVQLRSLRVDAQMDASKYAAGAEQKVAADRRMSASGREVGQTIQQTDQKISTSANGLERLMRQYVQGYSAEQRFEAALRTLQRAFDTGNVSAERAEQILMGLHQRYGLTANATSLMENGQISLAAAVTKANAAISAQGNVVDRAAAANDNWRRQSLRYQMFDIGQSIPLFFQSPVHGLLNFANQGAQIAQMYGPEEGGAARGLKEAAEMAGTLAARLAPIAAAAAAGGIAILGLRQEIQESTGVAVSFGDVFWGVLEAIGEGIYTLVQPAIKAIAPWFSAAWDLIVTATANGINSMVRMTLSGFEEIKFAVRALPSAAIIAGEAMANGFIAAVEKMVSYALKGFNKILETVNSITKAWGADAVLEWFGIQGQIEPAKTDVDLGHIDIGGKAASARLASLLRQREGAMAGIRETDYAGAAFDRIAGEAVENWRDRQKPSTGGGRERRSEYDRDLKSVRDRIEALQAERDAIDLTDTEAARLTVTRQLEAAAMRDSIGLTPARIAEIRKEADAYAAVVEEIEKAERAKENRQFWRDTAMGWVTDFRSAFDQALDEGKSKGEAFWEAFRQASFKALDRVIDKLLNEVMDAVFQVGNAGSGSGGGILSMLLGGVGSLLGFGGVKLPMTAPIPTARPSFDGGGFTGYGARSGGLDGRGGFAAILHPNETVIDHTRRPANQNAAPSVVINNTIQPPAGSTEEDAARFARAFARELKRQLPDAMEKVNSNPYRRAG